LILVNIILAFIVRILFFGLRALQLSLRKVSETIVIVAIIIRRMLLRNIVFKIILRVITGYIVTAPILAGFCEHFFFDWSLLAIVGSLVGSLCI
jgi:hypothetical protein